MSPSLGLFKLTFVCVECTHRKVHLWQMFPGKFPHAEYTWVTSAQTRKRRSNSRPWYQLPPNPGAALATASLACIWP